MINSLDRLDECLDRLEVSFFSRKPAEPEPEYTKTDFTWASGENPPIYFRKWYTGLNAESIKKTTQSVFVLDGMRPPLYYTHKGGGGTLWIPRGFTITQLQTENKRNLFRFWAKRWPKLPANYMDTGVKYTMYTG
jgi:hypothetical protein